MALFAPKAASISPAAVDMSDPAPLPLLPQQLAHMALDVLKRSAAA